MSFKHDTPTTTQATPPLTADQIVCCCARDALRKGADPVEVANFFGVCAANLYELLDYTPRQDAA